ncbi:MAG: FAD:protein FMN transferase [Nitrospinae bacterium]|nr:FAD:protein FMN transferase [Nitrospinota bacterium]
MLLILVSVPMVGKYKKLRLVDDNSFRGTAIGTNFSIIVSHTPLTNTEFEIWKREITLLVDQLDNSMSNYISDSEVSRLNSSPDIINFQPISEDLHTVVSASLEAYQETDGYFDITVSPLVDLWGFGPVPPDGVVPTDKEIKEILAHIGSNRLILTSQGIKKLDPKININVGAIAKGFLVDKVARFLLDKGCNNFMVEIGGEIVAKGVNKNGVTWRIGVETPDYKTEEAVYGVVELSDRGMATSGDYRRYLKDNGKVYSHIIDPKTGYPAQHSLASVTVIAENSMKADAYATALFVMGMEKGMAWVEKKEGVEAYFINRTADGGFVSKASSGFKIEAMNSSK